MLATAASPTTSSSGFLPRRDSRLPATRESCDSVDRFICSRLASAIDRVRLSARPARSACGGSGAATASREGKTPHWGTLSHFRLDDDAVQLRTSRFSNPRRRLRHAASPCIRLALLSDSRLSTATYLIETAHLPTTANAGLRMQGLIAESSHAESLKQADPSPLAREMMDATTTSTKGAPPRIAAGQGPRRLGVFMIVGAALAGLRNQHATCHPEAHGKP